jgi:hypothetical protein
VASRYGAEGQGWWLIRINNGDIDRAVTDGEPAGGFVEVYVHRHILQKKKLKQKVLRVVALIICRTCTRELTLENFCGTALLRSTSKGMGACWALQLYPIGDPLPLPL